MSTILDMPAKQQTRTGTPIGLRLDDALMKRMRDFQESLRPRPTLTAILEDALIEYLDRRFPEQDAKRVKR